jgi:uncharacterized membrane protein YdjX (TVP38/TMEM64 family)
MHAHPEAPWLYLLAFLCRPLVLLPAALFSVAAGYCFGLWWGMLWAHLAGILAALLGYGLGRWWGLGPQLPGWAVFMQRHGWISVILMRWSFLPYDPVSYLGGALRLPLLTFLLASSLGNLPGTTSCVLFGASLPGPLTGNVPINWRLQVASWVLLGGMLGLGRWLRKRLQVDQRVEGTSTQSGQGES